MEPEAPNILYSDAEVTVCVKPVGVSSETELPALLAAETGETALCVHRLDTAVGGVMVYAKTKPAAAALGRAMAEGRFQKQYLAVCAGTVEPPEGELRDYLFKDSRRNKVFVVSRPRKGVREAALSYRVLERRENAASLLVTLETGRSHQIRVQFASRRHPLLGDGKYGSRVKCPIALWAYSLAFPHPATGEALSFSCPPPNVFPWTQFQKL